MGTHKLNFLLLIFLSTTSSFALFNKPIIKKTGEEYILILPDDMKKVLHGYDTTFKIWSQRDYLPIIIKSYQPYHFTKQQAPFAVIGDFNGDNKLDVSLHGRNTTYEIVVCILSDENQYKVVEIVKLYSSKIQDYDLEGQKIYGLGIYLTHVKPGKIKSPFENQPLYLKNDAFEVNIFCKAAELYYFSKGKFLSYLTSD